MLAKETTQRFAVCLAAYNGMAFIAEQIESILLQKNVAVQIFISVDLSTDRTEYRLAEWALTESRLTLLPFGKRFGGAGPNFYRLLRDVDLSDFNYVSFADQDDIWHPEKLWRAHSLMTEQRALGYSSNFTAFWPAGEERFVNKARPQRTYDFLFESAGPGCTYVLHSSLAIQLQNMVRTEVGRIKNAEYHDWLFYAFARSHNFPWVIDSWSSMRYRQHANNQIGVNAGWASFIYRSQKVLSGHAFHQSLLISDLCNATRLPIVQRGLRGGRTGYMWLALNAGKCRRKPSERVWFFISCLLLAVVNPVIHDGK